MLKRMLPFLGWFEGYDGSKLRADLISGFTVALVLVPQSMAYAQLAGLPAYYGLYAAFLPPTIASLFGSSHQLATGPVAIVSLMTASTLEPLATAGSQEYIAYALVLALMVGLFQFLLGLLKLGVVVNFLSHPVVNGFSNAAALIIATSQLSKIFGVYVDKAHHHYETVGRVIAAAVHYTHWPTLGMAAISFATMIVLKRVNPKIPNVLVAVVITTTLAYLIGFKKEMVVDSARIADEETVESIEIFNQIVGTKESLEKQRGISRLVWEHFEEEGIQLCVRCHRDRDILGGTAVSTPPDADEEEDRNPLVLHTMSGLLDHHIHELKGLASLERTEIRERLFVRGRSTDGSIAFYRKGELPPEVQIVDRFWRIKIGAEVIPPGEIVMMGGGAVVGDIPKGLPGFHVPLIAGRFSVKLLVAAIIISLLGFMEAISIAKAMATRTHQKIDANQELIGQGLANIIGCVAQSYAVSGSFSRSAVNLQTGARTGLSNVFSSVIVMIVLLFFAGALFHLPQAVLASIIILAVFGLLNVDGFVHAWRTNRFDGIVAVLTFAGTLLFAPHLEWGIMIGVTLSLGGYLHRTMQPRVVELAPYKDGSLRDAARYDLPTCRHIVVIGFKGPLNFASTNYLESEIMRQASVRENIRHMLIAGDGINEIDASGEEALRMIFDNLRASDCGVSFFALPDKVVDVLKRSHLYDRIGEENFYDTRAEAISSVFTTTHPKGLEPDCPYLAIMPPIIEISLHGDGSLRNADRHDLPKCQHIAAFRFDGPLTVANAGYLEQEILHRITDRPRLRHVLLLAHAITGIDDAAAVRLGVAVKTLQADGFAISVSGLNEAVLESLDRSGVVEMIGAENVYSTQILAFSGVYSRAHTGSSEENCPLLPIVPRICELSVHDSGTLREAGEYHLKLCEHVAVLRFDGAMSLRSIRATQSEFIRWAKTRPTVSTLVFLANTFDKLNAAQEKNLCRFAEAIRDAGYRIVFAGFSDSVFGNLARRGSADEIGLEAFYHSGPMAISGVYRDAHHTKQEERCPLQVLLPRIIQLSLHPDGGLRNAPLHGLTICRHIIAFRFDGSLDFSTIGYFEDGVVQLMKANPESKHILFACHTITRIDDTAAELLVLFLGSLREVGYTVALTDLEGPTLETLHRASNWDLDDALFPSQARAIQALYPGAHRDSDEERCPFRQIVGPEEA